MKKTLENLFGCAIIRMHKKVAAVVQRLVPMLAMHMMTVRFRSVAPRKSLNLGPRNSKFRIWRKVDLSRYFHLVRSTFFLLLNPFFHIRTEF